MNPTFREAALHGFRHVLDFQGRDPRALFWPYAGAVLISWMVLTNAILIPVMLIQAWAGGGDSRQMTWVFLGVMAVGIIAMVILLAAATTRRLHDRGLRGTWAIVPAALVCIGLVLFAMLTGSDDEPGLALFFAGLVNNLLYFATLIALIVQLVQGSKPEGSRFDGA